MIEKIYSTNENEKEKKKKFNEDVGVKLQTRSSETGFRGFHTCYNIYSKSTQASSRLFFSFFFSPLVFQEEADRENTKQLNMIER